MTMRGALSDPAREDATLPSATLILRALIEEWWALKDAEPATARMAVPIT